MTPSWLLDLLAALMLAIAAVSVVRLAGSVRAPGRSWRAALQTMTDADVSHAAMGIAMAGMFTSRLATLSNTAWAVIFGLLTAWFAARIWLDGHGARALVTSRCTLHLLHCASMLYMFLALGTAASGGGGMSGMGGPAVQTLSYPTLAGVFVLLLVGCSVWDLNQLSGRRYSLIIAGGPATGTVATGTVAAGRVPAAGGYLLAPATKVGIEVIMGIAMAFMLVIMI
jgi:hypothetical protein